MNEVYNYFYDNGFFDNDYQSEITIKAEKKNEVILHKEKKNQIIYFLDNISGDDEIANVITLVLIYVFLVMLCGYFLSKDASFLILSILPAIGAVLFGITANGSNIAERLYAKSKGLCIGQTLYTITYNYEIIPVKLNFILLDGYDNEPMYSCELPEEYAEGFEDVRFYESELFSSPELASNAISQIYNDCVIALSDALSNKAEAFLNGDEYWYYADKYYRLNLKKCVDKIHRRDFLMSTESLVEFCKFIKSEKEKEAERAKIKNEQTAADNKLISDVVGDL